MSICEEGRFTGWCPLCYSGLRGRGTYRGHCGYVHRSVGKWEDLMSGLRRAPKPAAPSTVPSTGGPVVCEMSLPTLTDFLTLASWSDGCRRVLGTASLFWEDGFYKLWLNDKDGLRSCCLSAGTLQGLFLAANDRLEADDLEWRRARPETAKGRGK